MIAQPVVFDAQGNPLQAGTVITMAPYDREVDGPGYFDGWKGVVMSPRHVLPPKAHMEGYDVPVFFFSEVPGRYFHQPHLSHRVNISQWDEKYVVQMKEGDASFLYEPSTKLWMQCPRIHFFNSKELVVCPEGFTTKDLMLRMFPRGWSINSPTDTQPIDPKGYTCFIEGCECSATRTTIYSNYGHAKWMFACDQHHKAVHGKIFESPPKWKVQYATVFQAAATMFLR